MKIKSVGLDLDNTLIDYTQAYFKIAEIFGITLVDLNKDSIKQHLTDYKNNDVEWQRFQSILYTKG
jgi:FMN phosphatase YigB (HAD superfamily)